MAIRLNRWCRRWIITSLIWAVPVALVAVKEIREELRYNDADLRQTLTVWQDAPATCHGLPDEARASGCPTAALTRQAARADAARAEYAERRHTLLIYIGQALIGYWVVPVALMFLIGLLVAGIRLSLRRPSIKHGQPPGT